ncbi:hypothetical protein [Glycomyces salinus]|uniref:hypothetical protein n=1 Tax=Glycomyces salinus TaxID=980294 RepID=UPI0018ECEB1F|nr:hypothetical protein [Glycomyces salinus]
MRHTKILAASAAAAAAAVIPSGAAAASTPDWLTLANIESDQPSLLPMVCGEDDSGTVLDPACEGLLGTEQDRAAADLGEQLPDAPGGYGRTLANVDLRDFAKWQVCGIAVGATGEGYDCDNSITGEREPAGPGDAYSLVNADTTGSFDWRVCGVSAFEEASGSC